jgi:hypothetical protein
MLKHWNRRQPVKLQSYHLEVIALKLATSWTDHSWPIYQWFQSAQSATEWCWHAGQDISGYLTWEQANRMNGQLKTAEQIANTAWYRSEQGEHSEAIPLWRSIFGQTFPMYG